MSAVTKMDGLFMFSIPGFNQDLSKWDVSAVTDMRYMFHDAPAFNRELCGETWVNSKADKTDMFLNSPGSISSSVCTAANPGNGGDKGYR